MIRECALKLIEMNIEDSWNTGMLTEDEYKSLLTALLILKLEGKELCKKKSLNFFSMDEIIQSSLN